MIAFAGWMLDAENDDLSIRFIHGVVNQIGVFARYQLSDILC